MSVLDHLPPQEPDVEAASIGLRALEVLEKDSFEVVLTDIRMPQMGA